MRSAGGRSRWPGARAPVAAPPEALEGLGDDQLTITWQQQLTIDGTETAPENMTFVIARIGPTIFTVSGNDPDRTAATAEVLATRTRRALT